MVGGEGGFGGIDQADDVLADCRQPCDLVAITVAFLLARIVRRAPFSVHRGQ